MAIDKSIAAFLSVLSREGQTRCLVRRLGRHSEQRFPTTRSASVVVLLDGRRGSGPVRYIYEGKGRAIGARVPKGG